jgi:hypothetical protein
VNLTLLAGERIVTPNGLPTNAFIAKWQRLGTRLEYLERIYGTGGPGNLLDSATINVGTDGGTQHGYILSSFGTISNGAFAPKGGVTIGGIGYDTGVLTFFVQGNQTNADFYMMIVNGRVFPRSQATYNYSGVFLATFWTWPVDANPFSADGTDSYVSWY